MKINRTLTKKDLLTFVRLKRAAVDELRADYLQTLEGEIKKAGSSKKLAALLSRSSSFIRMVKGRSLLTVKDCVEEIAVKLYGWKE